jgi:hypothetical protein
MLTPLHSTLTPLHSTLHSTPGCARACARSQPLTINIDPQQLSLIGCREPESEQYLQALQLAVADRAKGEDAEHALTTGSPFSAITDHASAARARARGAMDKAAGRVRGAMDKAAEDVTADTLAGAPTVEAETLAGAPAVEAETLAEALAAESGGAGARAALKKRSGARKPNDAGGDEPAGKRGPGRPPKAPETLESKAPRLEAELIAEKKRSAAAEARATAAEARAAAAETRATVAESAKIKAESETQMKSTKLQASFFMLQAAHGRLNMPSSSSDSSTPDARAGPEAAKPTPTALEAFFEM